MHNDGMVYKNIIPRILKPVEISFFLFGPRGTGKSTWLRQTFRDAYFIDLLDEARYQRYLGDVGLFSAEIRSLPEEQLVVIDEVQRLPRLLNEVHRAIEDRGLVFILCGSSARKLKSGGVNLLAGRALYRHMHPFLPEEIGSAFDLNLALRQGTLPVVMGSVLPRETLEAYVRMYLKEEIQAEALVRNLPGFARFLPVAALFHGQLINASALARDVGVARTTVLGYLEILEDTLLSFRLPAYEGKLRVRERRHPKLYWTDAGLVRALKQRFDDPAPEELGHLFEGFIAQTLRAYRDYRGLFDEWFYWASATARKTEVDFLLRKGDQWVAIEVKSGIGSPDNADLRGLRVVSEGMKTYRRILLYRGEIRQKTEDGIEVLPASVFFEELATSRLMGN